MKNYLFLLALSLLSFLFIMSVQHDSVSLIIPSDFFVWSRLSDVQKLRLYSHPVTLPWLTPDEKQRLKIRFLVSQSMNHSKKKEALKEFVIQNQGN